jgi:2-oxoglutarate ferredoxin oxidoreductase subunit alpha
MDALAWLPERMKRKVNFLHLNVLLPFPSEEVQQVLRRSKKTLLIENNATGQLGGLLRQETGIKVQHHMLKYDGRPIYPIDIKERIMSL